MIEITGLEKRFGKIHVLRGLDLCLDRAKVTAILGPNASGKTTLIKCVLGLVQPARGSIVFDGVRLNGDWAYRGRIGYMPQIARFPDNLNAREVMAMLKDLRGRPAGADEDLLEAFRLDQELDKPLRTLSGGTRQKISAILAFLFNPDVLFLDEPTAGLDPVSSSILKDKILQERNAGKTFILASHIMSEIEELSDHIVFLLDGQVRFAGPLDEIKMSTGQHSLERAIAQMMVSQIAKEAA